MKISVLYNLPGEVSAQGIEQADEDTQKSAVGVAKGLKSLGYVVELVGIGQGDIGELRNLKTDMVFNLVEWAGKETDLGVEVVRTLEKMGLPYSGSNARGYKISCDKILMKELLDKSKILTPKWKLVEEVEDLESGMGKMTFPMISKPVYEHCGIGVSQTSVVKGREELEAVVKDLLDKYMQPVLVEEFIEGDEAHVTVLEKNGRPWVLPPAVMRYKKAPGYWPILSYEAKWEEDNWEAEMSEWLEKVDPRAERELVRVARLTYEMLGGRSYPRVDARIKAGRVYVLEINNNPGIDFDEGSGITWSARKAGLTWEGLLQNIVRETLLLSAGREAYVTAGI